MRLDDCTQPELDALVEERDRLRAYVEREASRCPCKGTGTIAARDVLIRHYSDGYQPARKDYIRHYPPRPCNSMACERLRLALGRPEWEGK